MKTFQHLTPTEARLLTGGGDPTTNINTTSTAAYDLSYLAGYIVGNVIGFFVSMSEAQPISVVDWKTGIRTSN